MVVEFHSNRLAVDRRHHDEILLMNWDERGRGGERGRESRTK